MTSTPEKVGRFRIECRLGEGGMGEVYRAYDEEQRRTVVLKRLPPEAAADRSLRKRFHREAESVAQLRHPAIVPVLEVFEHTSGHWIVMEHVQGESLAEIIDREGPQPPDRVRRLARQIADGLAAAHDLGIIHRDLKTENVIVTRAGAVKIIDFGLAKNLTPESGDSTLTTAGSIVGTCRTMSPEQALADEVDHRADLHALGVLMYEALAGFSPFAAGTTLETLSAIVTRRQPPIREANPQVPAELADLIDRLLEKRPADRPGDAREVIEVLDQMQSRPARHVVGKLFSRAAAALGWRG